MQLSLGKRFAALHSNKLDAPIHARLTTTGLLAALESPYIYAYINGFVLLIFLVHVISLFLGSLCAFSTKRDVCMYFKNPPVFHPHDPVKYSLRYICMHITT